MSGHRHVTDLVAAGEYWHESEYAVIRPAATAESTEPDAAITLRAVQQEESGTPGLYRHDAKILLGSTPLTPPQARDLAAALTALSEAIDASLPPPASTR